ncbi:MAG: restriction endonuclease subunit S [Phormidesmis sp. CAN_BIN44]|nr:restriction endonuclease subunit S [Phormidesmis sp. CAN_BIN44]
MSDWTDTALGEILQFQRGFDITKKEQENGIFPVVSSSGITSYHNKAKGKAPGVVIGRKGTLGTVHYVNSDYWAHDTTLWVKDFKGNLPKFIYYFLKVMHLENYDTGASNPTLNRNHIHKIKLKCPSLPIQKKIAAVLSAYDDLIENNDRRIALLEKMAEEIYREWFIRMRFPGHEQAIFHKGIPESWRLRKLEDIVELAYGKALKEEDRIPGDYPVFGSSGIVGTHKGYLVKAPGIILGRKGNVGSIHWSEQRFYPIDTVYYIKSNLSFYFLFFLLQSLNFINNDAAVPGLNRKQAYANTFYLPPQPLIEKYAETAKDTFDCKNNLRKQNEILKQTRDLLLTRLISSKLSVEDLDIQLPPSMTADS